MARKIDWSDERSQLALLEQGMASKLYVGKCGKKEQGWVQNAEILNREKFAGYQTLGGPGYKKRFFAILDRIALKYAFYEQGANLSALPEDAPEVDRLATQLLVEIEEDKVIDNIYNLTFITSLF